MLVEKLFYKVGWFVFTCFFFVVFLGSCKREGVKMTKWFSSSETVLWQNKKYVGYDGPTHIALTIFPDEPIGSVRMSKIKHDSLVQRFVSHLQRLKAELVFSEQLSAVAMGRCGGTESLESNLVNLVGIIEDRCVTDNEIMMTVATGQSIGVCDLLETCIDNDWRDFPKGLVSDPLLTVFDPFVERALPKRLQFKHYLSNIVRNFYLFKHFSRFLHQDAVRIACQGDLDCSLAFKNGDGDLVLLCYNDYPIARRLEVQIAGKVFYPLLGAHSLNTFLFKSL